MHLRSIHEAVPHLTDEQILAVATALYRQPKGDRVLIASMLGLNGVKTTLNSSADGLRKRGGHVKRDGTVHAHPKKME